MENKRIHAIVHGRVQGVFYRSHTQKKASSLWLKGWVRNCEDGTVELVAEGSEKNLRELIKWCNKGPAISNVEKVEVKWENPTGEFKAFSIRY